MKISARRARPDTYTKLLIKAFGANGSTTFKDFSQSGHTITVNGNVQMSTAQAKFPPVSIAFDGTGDYLSLADNADWDLFANSGDLATIDFWFKFVSDPPAETSYNYITHTLSPGTDTRWIVGYYDNAGYGIYFHIVEATTEIVVLRAAEIISDANWHHIAVVKNGTTWYLFIDGVQKATTTDSSVLNITAPLYIGWGGNVGQYMNGWMDEVRISKGIARWTANFTPPTRRY